MRITSTSTVQHTHMQYYITMHMIVWMQAVRQHITIGILTQYQLSVLCTVLAVCTAVGA